jgi:hypothetical protein
VGESGEPPADEAETLRHGEGHVAKERGMRMGDSGEPPEPSSTCQEYVMQRQVICGTPFISTTINAYT